MFGLGSYRQDNLMAVVQDLRSGLHVAPDVLHEGCGACVQRCPSALLPPEPLSLPAAPWRRVLGELGAVPGQSLAEGSIRPLSISFLPEVHVLRHMALGTAWGLYE